MSAAVDLPPLALTFSSSFPNIEPVSDADNDVSSSSPGSPLATNNKREDGMRTDPLSPMNINALDILDFDWTMALQDDKTVMGLNVDLNPIELNPIEFDSAEPASNVLARPDAANNNSNNMVVAAADEDSKKSKKTKATKKTKAASSSSSAKPADKPTRLKRKAANNDDEGDASDEDYKAASHRKPNKRRKTEADDLNDNLDDSNLSADEVAALRKEARMARNRASAERTRIRRLQYTATLEEKTAQYESMLKQAADVVRGYVAGRGDAILANQLLAAYELFLKSNSSGPVRKGYHPRTTRKSLIVKSLTCA